MNSKSLARPYAKAAFEAAKSTNQVSLWSHALKQLAVAVLDKTMLAAIKNPTLSSKKIK